MNIAEKEFYNNIILYVKYQIALLGIPVLLLVHFDFFYHKLTVPLDSGDEVVFPVTLVSGIYAVYLLHELFGFIRFKLRYGHPCYSLYMLCLT